MRQALFRLGLALAIAASLIVLAWLEMSNQHRVGWATVEGLVGIVIGSFIGAVILRAGAAWVERKDVKYADAYATILLGGIATLILVVALRPRFDAALHWDSEMASRVTVVAVFLLTFPLYAGLIGGRHGISFRRACLVYVVMLAVSVVLVLSVVGLAFLIMWAYRRAGVL
jgi:hypothetical protein